MITLSTCYYLHYARTGYKRIGDAVTVALLSSMPLDPIFFGFFQITIQLYINAILTSLNTRATLQTYMAGNGLGPEIYGLTHNSPTTHSISPRSLEIGRSLKLPDSPFERREPRGKLSMPSRAVVKSQPQTFSNSEGHFIRIERSVDTYTDEYDIESARGMKVSD
ncbi:hypothetical protein SISNIDRAFT_471184 [Sistotremastrum niveocremeum HHB9708]|uniref:Uncharacterized protein n=1 Tax=Sistotremastrum niveocremeum HHB9708 TaxID=1314777 RepID=A0A164MY31_9AGAM|nr:hypothetical protein SISNIDRAFT_471184 [Sistotremastrum niveocremeum HHB9708]